MRRPKLSSILMACSLLALAACGSPPDRQGEPAANAANAAASSPTETLNAALNGTGEAPAASPLAETAETGPLSCAAEIGAAAAEKRVRLCRQVSPATRPPCNAANSCAMIEDEIARSCALIDGFGEEGKPTPGCSPSPGSMAAAANVVKLYYAAIDARDFGTAWSQWGENGPPDQTMDGFQAGFASTRSTRVTIGKLEPGDAGAGSIYQTVPVTVDSQLRDGKRQRFIGDYVVRRVNGVDGASSSQLRWHIGAAKLKAVPAE
ncbi:hypothetical protein [Sphingobium sp.]|uniref:hypothetical protein n=1 Tax=Sphingobium sp. TaxID=1912891 RepID=UPI002D06DE96|nr:hypothetical protein [Sphingobium sp.]HUD93121.1 hypothetical protein [Sphingobium sp.]